MGVKRRRGEVDLVAADGSQEASELRSRTLRVSHDRRFVHHQQVKKRLFLLRPCRQALGESSRVPPTTILPALRRAKAVIGAHQREAI